MNDKDFKFDFYIGGDDNADAAENENIQDSDIESEILLNDFAKEESETTPKMSKNIFVKFKKWWKRRKKWQKAVMITAVSVILALAIFFGVVWGIVRAEFDYNYNQITGDHEDLGIENVIDKDIVNVALFGIDTRSLNSFKGNSDSIMVLSLNTETKKVKIISLMRDTLVPITYNGKTSHNKINSAYATGGPELAIKVINSNFGLDITEYATVNFFGMVDIIDAVGGIEAELTSAETATASRNMYAINGCILEICNKLGIKPEQYYITSAGKHHLNGIQAVAYSRIRYVANIWGTNNDYGRTDRQRYVMEQLFNKALTVDKSQYIKLAKSLIPCTETSLSYTEIIGLAFDILLESPTFEQARIPREDMLMTAPSTKAGSVVYYDLDFAKTLIHAFIYDDITFDEYVEENGVEKYDWYRLGPKSSSNSSSNKNDNKTSSVQKPNTTESKNNESATQSGDYSSKGENDSSGIESDVSDTESTDSSSTSSDKNTSDDGSSKNELGSSSDNDSSKTESKNTGTGSSDKDSSDDGDTTGNNSDDNSSNSSKDESNNNDSSADKNSSSESGTDKTNSENNESSNISSGGNESSPDNTSSQIDTTN